MEESYDTFILKTLTIPDQLCDPKLKGTFPLSEEIYHFCREKGIGISGMNKYEAVETILFERGISNAEMKEAFLPYLGLPASYFNKKYCVNQSEIENMAEQGLLLVVNQVGAEKLYDAEFYFDTKKFMAAWSIADQQK